MTITKTSKRNAYDDDKLGREILSDLTLWASSTTVVLFDLISKIDKGRPN